MDGAFCVRCTCGLPLPTSDPWFPRLEMRTNNAASAWTWGDELRVHCSRVERVHEACMNKQYECWLRHKGMLGTSSTRSARCPHTWRGCRAAPGAFLRVALQRLPTRLVLHNPAPAPGVTTQRQRVCRELLDRCSALSFGYLPANVQGRSRERRGTPAPPAAPRCEQVVTRSQRELVACVWLQPSYCVTM